MERQINPIKEAIRIFARLSRPMLFVAPVCAFLLAGVVYWLLPFHVANAISLCLFVFFVALLSEIQRRHGSATTCIGCGCIVLLFPMLLAKSGFPPVAECLALHSAHRWHEDLSGLDWSDADLDYVDLSHLKLSGTDFSSAHLQHADMVYANLEGAKLVYAWLNDADCSHANLTHADLSSTLLLRADLQDADLSNANLSEANLVNANLRGANLSYTNLREANLSDANLEGANIEGALYDSTTFFPAGFDTKKHKLVRFLLGSDP